MPEKIKKNILRAYTLIEVVAVMAIISIVSSVILVNVRSSRIPRELESNARLVVSVFREAQNYALTGHQGVVGTDPCGYEVWWNGVAYGTTYHYKSGGVCNPTPTFSLAAYTLQSGVSFSGAGSSVTFAPPHAVMNPTTDVTVTLTKAGSSHVVCVRASGLINNNAGAACL